MFTNNMTFQGFAAAVLSHPADTLLSQINKGHGPSGSMTTRLATLAKEAGFRGLFSGLGPRMVRFSRTFFHIFPR
jgi:solute carrier family 25 (mitochondrial phosphate transporter), member 3